MNTTDRIKAKRRKLNFLRHSIRQTMGPPRNIHSMGLGLIFAGFALGVMAERWGFRHLAVRLLSLNRVVGFIP